jgi:hypothetical protein
MYNICPVTPSHSTYMTVINNTLKIFEYYATDTARTLHKVLTICVQCHFCSKTCVTPKKCHMYTAVQRVATCLAIPHSTILN